jgi:hypothetical protein
MGEPEVDRGEAHRIGDARGKLALLAAAMLLSLLTALTPDPHPSFDPPPGSTGDLDLFRRVVQGVSLGDTFYDATQREFRAHGYPTRSVFNWRTPCYAWLLGRVTGVEPGRWLLMIGVITAVVMSCRDMIEDCGLLPGSVGGVMLVGATAWCFGGPTVYFTEVWAGTLILLSLCALRRGLTPLGVLFGVMAVFYRELAALYLVVCLVLAFREGRKREAAFWGVGLALFTVFFAGHAAVILSRLTPADLSMQGGWVRFGGMRFLLATAQSNVFLMSQPPWVTALYLPLSCLGFLGMKGETGRRVGLSGAAYLLAFSMVGGSFNFYWGFVTAPLLALGFAFAPAALCDLLTTAFETTKRAEFVAARV